MLTDSILTLLSAHYRVHKVIRSVELNYWIVQYCQNEKTSILSRSSDKMQAVIYTKPQCVTKHTRMVIISLAILYVGKCLVGITLAPHMGHLFNFVCAMISGKEIKDISLLQI